MKRARTTTKVTSLFSSLCKQRSFQILIIIAVLYVLLFTLEIPFVFNKTAVTRSERHVLEQEQQLQPSTHHKADSILSSLILNDAAFDSKEYQLSVKDGKRVWNELQSAKTQTPIQTAPKPENRPGLCPRSVSVTGSEFAGNGSLMVIPCGLTLGSHITVVGKPLSSEGKNHFFLELQGLKTVEGEDPPRILHFNPRLKGDWSGKPVIELNSCYRMQWGTSLRCDGWKSRADQDTGNDCSNFIL